MDNNHSTGLTIKELKNNMKILDVFPETMEVIEALTLFEKYCEAQSDSNYEIIVKKLKSGSSY